VEICLPTVKFEKPPFQGCFDLPLHRGLIDESSSGSTTGTQPLLTLNSVAITPVSKDSSRTPWRRPSFRSALTP
jgi:hypothetical protein